MHEHERRAAIEMLLSRKINLGSRRDVRRALSRTNIVPAIARRYPHVYEAFVTCCMAGAKVERLERLLRGTLH